MPVSTCLLIVAALLVLKVLALHLMGRPLACPCGIVRPWHGGRGGPEDSQQVADWYSASHVIFGVLLYWLMWKTSRHWPILWLFVVAVASSVVWEVIENTPAIIARFGAGEAGAPYAGDSILNSMGDTLAVLAGFALARVLPVPATIALAVGLEIAALLAIRDNFLLTALLFLHPFEAILAWRGG